MTLAGQQLGHYRLLRLIGQGGMGEVYLAQDTRLPRQVAVKVIRYEHQPYPDANALEQAERLFQREMKALSLLDHPHILSFHDFNEEQTVKGSLIYMVMPYRAEGSLSDWLLGHGSALLAPQDVGYLIAQAASALQHAHDHHIIHQDVKPSNFLVRANQDAPTRPDLFLVDFGIAKIFSATSMASQSVRGTAIYMAPEQWSGEPVPATDQYALAIMTYQLLTGQLPFQGRTQQQIMFQHLTIQPPAPSQHNVRLSPAVDTVLLRALAKRADERFPNIKTFALALQQALASAELQTTLEIGSQETQRSSNANVPLAPRIALAPPSPSQTPLSMETVPATPFSLGISHPPSTTQQSTKAPKSRIFLVVIIVLLVITSSLAVRGLIDNTHTTNSATATAPTQSSADSRTTPTAVAQATVTPIAVHPNPYSPSGTLLLSDSLSQPHNWYERSRPSFGGQCQFVGGALQITQAPPNKFFNCDERNVYSNFAFEVRMRIDQGDCGGLTTRSNDDYSNLYVFKVCQNGSYAFEKYSSNADFATLTSGNTAVINQGINQVNAIAVVADGRNFVLYINAQRIGDASDGTYSQGILGCVASAITNATIVTYQDARVWTM
ncbi:MAG: hypothetical protein E6J34_06455 [Chloroflexi bacterium]|nr:MAG: hypothetical protein E6J34_06455 [Chloroflexota bacterium]